MKNIFKKNHIIITALAIMIVIAGYISFTNNDSDDGTQAVDASGDYEEYTEVEGSDVLADTEDGTQVMDADNAESAGSGEDTDVLAVEDGDVKAASEDEDAQTSAQNEDGEEITDISDEDLMASAQDVSDNGELNLEEGVPGEAVLANAAIDPSFFISNKIEKEQTRAKNKQTYLDIYENESATEEQKQAAFDAMMEQADNANKESDTEILLEAKGFDGSIVSINDGKVEVVVNAQALSDQQLAIVESVVKDKTGIDVANIEIHPVVIAE